MNVKIVGLDESGKYGDNQIFFSQIELNEEFEADIFIDNILNTKNFFYKDNELKGWDPIKKVNLCHKIINKGLIKLNFFKLNPIEQNKIFRDIYKFQAGFLYNEREKLIEIFEGNKESKDLSDIIAQLYHYREPHFLPDFCMKSYSYLYILYRFCCKETNTKFLQQENSLIKTQIDGGNLFSYWWKDFISNHNQKDLLENKLFINGISHGDKYYLSMNLADLFAKAFNERPQSFFRSKIEDVIYKFNDINCSKDLFYEKLWYYLKNPYFKNRILFFGQSEAFNLIPHLLHFKKRTIIYEPFHIKKNVEDFFRYFKIGPVKKNLVVYSKKLSKDHKKNVDYCEELGIKIMRIDELKDNFLDFYNFIEEATKYYDHEVHRKVQTILDKYKTYF